MAEHTLSVHVDRITGGTQKLEPLDTRDQHAVESKKLEAHLDDYILHCVVAGDELDVLNFSLVDLLLSSTLFGLCEFLISLQHEVRGILGVTMKMLLQIVCRDPFATGLFIIEFRILVFIDLWLFLSNNFGCRLGNWFSDRLLGIVDWDFSSLVMGRFDCSGLYSWGQVSSVNFGIWLGNIRHVCDFFYLNLCLLLVSFG